MFSRQLFDDEMTADKNSRIYSEVSRAIWSAHVQPNASELIGQRFTVQMDNFPKAMEDFSKAKKWNLDKTERKIPKVQVRAQI